MAEKITMEKRPLVIIAGPTASGKTALSLAVATAFDAEIVCADSMQIYRGMDIGTAKPTAEEQQKAIHHMIDLIWPDEAFSVAQYAVLARKCIDAIQARGRLPILVGGTGLYIDHVSQNVSLMDMQTDTAYRQELAGFAKTHGNEALHERLAQVDPDAAAGIHPNNVKRLIRALEVYHVTGRTMTELKKQALQQSNSPYRCISFMPDWPRDALYARIEQRVDQMFAQGLVGEVRNLIQMGYSKSLNSMQAIGYKELYDYFYGLDTLQGACDRIKKHTRNYAKRQLTWFRRYDQMRLLLPGSDMAQSCINQIAQWLQNT